MKSNFDFMENINLDYYNKLVKAEKKLYTSKYETGKELRSFWEAFTNDIITKNGLYDKLKKQVGEARINLATCIVLLTEPSNNNKNFSNRNRDEGWVDSLRTLMKSINDERVRNGEKQIKLFKEQQILATFTPKYSQIKFSRFYNKTWRTEQNVSLMHFFRQYCNDCAHDPNSPEPPFYDVTHIQTIDYLSKLHTFLKNYFEVSAPAYNENLILFDDFEVTNVNASPSDGFRSGCCKECNALHYPTSGFTKSYPAIIRFFNKNEIDKDFVSRSASVYSLVDKNTCGKGLRYNRELSNFESDSEFYVIAYVFENEPTILTNELLKETPLTTRIEWCKEIAEIIENLHTNNPPIYHRLINNSSIYITKEGRNNQVKFVPSLIKMSFAKIGDAAANTVYEKAASAVEQTIQRRPEESKYIAPEYARLNNSINGQAAIYWDKIDVFSLGMLISDILCADISKKPHSAAELKSAGIDNQIIEIIAKCFAPAQNRPTASQILSVLQNF